MCKYKKYFLCIWEAYNLFLKLLEAVHKHILGSKSLKRIPDCSALCIHVVKQSLPQRAYNLKYIEIGGIFTRQVQKRHYNCW